LAYSTTAILRQRLGSTGAITDETILQNALDWAQRFVEDYTHRTFEARTETRYYDRSALCYVPQYGRRLLVLDDDLLTVTTLTNGDSAATVLSSSTYWLVCLDPAGGWTRNQPPNRDSYDGILLKSDYAWEVETDTFISVAGTWGWTTTADDLISDSTLRLAEYQYRSKKPLTTTTIFDGSQQKELPEGFPTDVLTALEARRRLV
jgi:hypothetical protein